MDAAANTAALTVTTAVAIVFGPYLTKDNIVCNNGTRWKCYCSVSFASSISAQTVPRCVDMFANDDVVAVDFRGCTMNLNSSINNSNQTFELYLKNYFISWIKQECAMSPCRGYKGRDTEIEIMFVLLACSSQKNSRLLLKAVQKNGTLSNENYEQFPSEIFHRILNDRLHLLQYFLSTTVNEVSIIKVPKYSTVKTIAKAKDEYESESAVDPPKPFNWTAVIIGVVLAVYFSVVWIVACFLCHK